MTVLFFNYVAVSPLLISLPLPYYLFPQLKYFTVVRRDDVVLQGPEGPLARIPWTSVSSLESDGKRIMVRVGSGEPVVLLDVLCDNTWHWPRAIFEQASGLQMTVPGPTSLPEYS